MRRIVATLVALATVGSLVLAATPAHAGQAWVEKAQRRLNALHCQAGPADGELGPWTRSAVHRFQARHGLAQTGQLTEQTRKRLYAESARRCDVRPVPDGSGKGRRVVLSQRQNWLWLVGPKGGVVAQGGLIDNPGELAKGSYATGSYCGRAARIKRNTDYGGDLWLDNFVRFAPCGFGFHRIPRHKSSGEQIHPDFYLGTNLATSSGCIRLSRGMSLRLWDFTTQRTRVRVV